MATMMMTLTASSNDGIKMRKNAPLRANSNFCPGRICHHDHNVDTNITATIRKNGRIKLDDDNDDCDSLRLPILSATCNHTMKRKKKRPSGLFSRVYWETLLVEGYCNNYHHPRNFLSSPSLSRRFLLSICLLVFLVLVLVVPYNGQPISTSSMNRTLRLMDFSSSKDRHHPIQIIFPRPLHHRSQQRQESSTSFSLHERELDRNVFLHGRKPDYGAIECEKLDSSTTSSLFERMIPHDADRRYEKYQTAHLLTIDEDLSREYYHKDDKEDDEHHENRRTPDWVSSTFPNCNHVHEIVVERPLPTVDAENDTHSWQGSEYSQDYNVTYLSHGTYRDAWRFWRLQLDEADQYDDDEFEYYNHFLRDDLVLKRLMMDRNFDAKDLHKVHREAIVMERLTALSPRIVEIYGHCGTSLLIESMESDILEMVVPGDGFVAQTELEKLDNVYPRNNLTASEKLQLSLSMAESLADLHDYKDGIIIHSDVHIEQWLLSIEGDIKLNDFNNAHVLQWDETNQQHCDEFGLYAGVYRSPEELAGSAQDETKDTYSYGNNVYALLTGLWPFYDLEYHKKSRYHIQNRIIAGIRPYVDERYSHRSYIESMLVKIMKDCWAAKPEDRPRMADVAKFLRQVKLEAWEKGELESSNLINIM